MGKAVGSKRNIVAAQFEYGFLVHEGSTIPTVLFQPFRVSPNEISHKENSGWKIVALEYRQGIIAEILISIIKGQDNSMVRQFPVSEQPIKGSAEGEYLVTEKMEIGHLGLETPNVFSRSPGHVFRVK